MAYNLLKQEKKATPKQELLFAQKNKNKSINLDVILFRYKISDS